jgi:hypothetical protein
VTQHASVFSEEGGLRTLFLGDMTEENWSAFNVGWMGDEASIECPHSNAQVSFIGEVPKPFKWSSFLGNFGFSASK